LKRRRFPILRVAIVAFFASSLFCCAQQTIFNVPSPDVMDPGKVYGELDISYQERTSAGNFVPRVVVGAGHDVEVGLNLSTFLLQPAQWPSFRL
jgi:hypothetical protein